MGEAIKLTLDKYLLTKDTIKFNENDKPNVIPDNVMDAIVKDDNNEKYVTKYKNILNTHALPYAFTLNGIKPNNTAFPEVGMMFIKTYIKQLLPDDRIKSESFYKVFNKNHELVEIPYAVALYLGGLYYFSENDKAITNEIALDGNLFNVTNGIKMSISGLQMKNDVYDSDIIKKTPLYYATNTDGSNIIERLYAPSIKVLNRSLYDIHTNKPDSFSSQFNIKISANGDTKLVDIPFKTIMPAVGFGIQNNFLNIYNKTMFGDYLNGTKDIDDAGKPHSIIGGYCGISKPIKTYRSYDFEFTAFYRNLHVGGFNYNIDNLVTELSAITTNIKYDFKSDKHPLKSVLYDRPGTLINKVDITNIVSLQDTAYIEKYKNNEKPANNDDAFLSANFPKDKIIKAFIVYSKLKANYLSGAIANNDQLYDAIKKLCTVKNIKSVFNNDRKALKLSEVSDFYYLVSHFFFTSYKKLIHNHNTISGGNFYDLTARLNFGMGLLDKKKSYDYQRYQKDCLPNDLNNLLNPTINSVDDEVNALTDFLSYIWNLEKINLKPEFNKVGGSLESKAVYALYPSCGGAISPEYLYSDGKSSLVVRYTNYNSFVVNGTNNKQRLSNSLYKVDNNVRSKENYGKMLLPKTPKLFGGSNPTQTLADFNNDEAKSNYLSALKTRTVATNGKYFTFTDNPLVNKYFIDTRLDNKLFLETYRFDNRILLKNTTRFLWFDPTNYSDKIIEERPLDDNLMPFYSNNSGLTGVDLMLTNAISANKNYYNLNTTTTYDYGSYTKLNSNDYFEQYKLTNLMDSLDFEKLKKFSELFLDFCKINSKPTLLYNDPFHTLRSLILSSSCILHDDLVDTTFENYTWTRDEINLMLIGNSLYQYEFLSESGIANVVNHALTLAQYNKFNGVADEFCSSTITVANFSPNTSISYDPKSISSLHRVTGLPEILFSNRENYDDILTLLEKTTEEDKDKMGIYFTRKILFGDQYIEPFDELNLNDVNKLDSLNRKYLINKLYTHNLFSNKNDDIENLYRLCVSDFFRTLNIKFTENRYKQLHKFIRTYVYRIFRDNGILNDWALPNQKPFKDPQFTEFLTKYTKSDEVVDTSKNKVDAEDQKINNILKEANVNDELRIDGNTFFIGPKI